LLQLGSFALNIKMQKHLAALAKEYGANEKKAILYDVGQYYLSPLFFVAP